MRVLTGLDQIVPLYHDVQQSLATPGTGLAAGLLLNPGIVPSSSQGRESWRAATESRLAKPSHSNVA
jgi:hypothetical protein